MSIVQKARQKFPVGSLLIHELAPNVPAIHLVHAHNNTHLELLLLFRKTGHFNYFNTFEKFLSDYRKLIPFLTGSQPLYEVPGHKQTVNCQTVFDRRTITTLAEAYSEGLLEDHQDADKLFDIQRTYISLNILELNNFPVNGL